MKYLILRKIKNGFWSKYSKTRKSFVEWGKGDVNLKERNA